MHKKANFYSTNIIIQQTIVDVSLKRYKDNMESQQCIEGLWWEMNEDGSQRDCTCFPQMINKVHDLHRHVEVVRKKIDALEASKKDSLLK